MRKFLRSSSGFTLIELLIAIVIMVIAVGTISATSVNLYRGYKRQAANNNLYEESRVLLERLSRETMVRTVDYDEYFDHLSTAKGGMINPAVVSEKPPDYGKFYREYSRRFQYIAPPENIFDFNNPQRYELDPTDPQFPQDTNEGFFSTGGDNLIGNDNAGFTALGGSDPQTELYLISPDGKEKTIFKLLSSGQIGTLVLDLQEQYDNTKPLDEKHRATDGFYDSWTPASDFTNAVDGMFIPISPPDITISNLKFFIAPGDDPRKEFTSNDPAQRAHPNVTIIFTASVASSVAAQFTGEGIIPSITLETTVSSRLYDNVEIPFGVVQ